MWPRCSYAAAGGFQQRTEAVDAGGALRRFDQTRTSAAALTACDGRACTQRLHKAGRAAADRRPPCPSGPRCRSARAQLSSGSVRAAGTTMGPAPGRPAAPERWAAWRMVHARPRQQLGHCRQQGPPQSCGLLRPRTGACASRPSTRPSTASSSPAGKRFTTAPRLRALPLQPHPGRSRPMPSRCLGCSRKWRRTGRCLRPRSCRRRPARASSPASRTTSGWGAGPEESAWRLHVCGQSMSVSWISGGKCG